MVFVACGLNHKTAPLNIREKFAIASENSDQLLHNFSASLNINEVAILSTCNRTEIYCSTDNPDKIIPWVANTHQIPNSSIIPYFYTHCEKAGIRHLLRVGSGLDSMMLGEPQILGQIKQAYNLALEAGTIGSQLDSVFQYIFQTCKKIRNLSDIGKNPTSISYAASQLVGQIFNNFANLNVFLIGSGETATLVAKYLQEAGVKKFMVTNRSQDKADILSKKLSGRSIPILDIAAHLSEADVIISATSCPLPFISKSMVESALLKRNSKPMFFLDLAVPRDIEQDIIKLGDAVHLYNIDDLQNVTANGLQAREKAAKKAENLIDKELSSYIDWQSNKKTDQIISNYHAYMQRISNLELLRATNKLSKGECPYLVLSEFRHRLTNKLTHIPKVGLRQLANTNQDKLQNLINHFSNKKELT
ncbi:MAG: glutamyl-tRNA reductase [Legionellales bacterium RIFCSPHIGHO2_12_FULL_35_11]|nr:MAG: glutamyl-tRNA reductase [Legionellales bacterium RIFCSPHIGHO2_12_FULL_35_11]